MNSTIRTMSVRHWIQAVLLVLGIIVALPQGHAQEMTSNFDTDSAIIENALSSTITAASGKDTAAARVSMENLYRLWRSFRQRNIEGRPQDVQFAPTLLKTEERLFAASQQIDRDNLAAARAELEEARKLLGSVQAPGPAVER